MIALAVGPLWDSVVAKAESLDIQIEAFNGTQGIHITLIMWQEREYDYIESGIVNRYLIADDGEEYAFLLAAALDDLTKSDMFETFINGQFA